MTGPTVTALVLFNIIEILIEAEYVDQNVIVYRNKIISLCLNICLPQYVQILIVR